MHVVSLERNDPKFENAFVEAISDERVLVRCAGLAREHDRVIRGLVREAAVLDEVHAHEVGA